MDAEHYDINSFWQNMSSCIYTYTEPEPKLSNWENFFGHTLQSEKVDCATNLLEFSIPSEKLRSFEVHFRKLSTL